MQGKIINRVKTSIQRRLNQLCAYDYPGENAGWHKYENNPVLGNTTTGSLFDPCVRKIDGLYIMCLSCRRTHSIKMLSSEDGYTWNWDNAVEILVGINNSNWETRVNRACFLVKDNIWHLWYTGQNNGISKIGYAVSKDGINYIRMSSEPVLIPEYDFEGENVMNPCVLWDEEKCIYCMWYAAGEGYEPDVICYAESKDGKHWVKRTKPVKCADPEIAYEKSKVGACDVIRSSDNKYVMAYIAYQNVNVSRICLAYSDNPTDAWKKIDDVPILSPEKGKWDAHAVYKPTLCIDQDNKSTILWYNGRAEHNERIGVATLKRII